MITMHFSVIAFLFMVFQSGLMLFPPGEHRIVINQKRLNEADTVDQNGFQLVFIQQDVKFDTAVANRLQGVFFQVYPTLVATFNPDAVRQVTLTIDTTYDGVAYAHDGQIVISQAWLEKKPGDVDIVTHEVMHIVQAYPPGSEPGWLVEGIADYIRHKYGVDNAGADWSLPDLQDSHHYTQSYRIAARFLDWIEGNQRPGLVKVLDEAMRTHTYTEGIWETETGLTLDGLWAVYAAGD